MKFYLLESIKHQFIGKYILPLYEPAIEYFSQYGIEADTVYTIPSLIVLIIFTIKYEDKKSWFFIVLLVGIGLMVFVIIKSQLWGWDD
jgi:hypothetical protein